MRETERVAREMKAAGHAVLLDVTYDAKGNIVRELIHHYLTCRKCLQSSTL